MTKKMDLDAAIDVADPAAGDGNPDDIIEQYKKESAGKDRKVTALLNENQKLKEQLENNDRQTPEEIKRLTDLAIELGAKEKFLASQEVVLNEAIKKKIPVTLALRNADNMEELEQELKEMALDRTRYVWEGGRSHDGITYPQIAKMTRGEISRIPEHIIERLRVKK